GPGNSLIDGIIQVLSNGKLAYDRDGQMAASGQVNPSWLEELMVEDTYVHRAPPKTTGRELYGPAQVQKLIKDGRDRSLPDKSIVATVTAFTAQTIAHSYREFLPVQVDEVIVGGGGSRNPVLMQLLRSLVAPATVLTHEDIGINSDLKEALVMAVLAYETWHMRPGNLPALTGAREQVVLGHIAPGKNYVDLIRKTWCA
ncbi:MAG: anhydro-N-acetylmuramic acid kinase, partial [Chloroflexota bacterium]